MFLTFANNNHICFIDVCSSIFRPLAYSLYIVLLCCTATCLFAVIFSFFYSLSHFFSYFMPFQWMCAFEWCCANFCRYKNRGIVFRCFHSFHLNPYSFIYWYHWVDRIYSFVCIQFAIEWVLCCVALCECCLYAFYLFISLFHMYDVNLKNWSTAWAPSGYPKFYD